jgi:hypothetical protein
MRATYPSHPPWLDSFNYISRCVQVMKLLTESRLTWPKRIHFRVTILPKFELKIKMFEPH